MSHPTMGAWIEIQYSTRMETSLTSRTPRWVRGLKSKGVQASTYKPEGSHPTMGAWIEIIVFSPLRIKSTVAPHDGCVD